MYETEIIALIKENPGCTSGDFQQQLTSFKAIVELDQMVQDSLVIRRYVGMVPHYYLPDEPHKLAEIDIGLETI